MSLFSNIGDALFGKKSKKIKADPVADRLRSAQEFGINSSLKGLKSLDTALDTPADNIVREQAAQETKSILSSAQDARRSAQRLMAQRGLSGSSLGLGLNRSIDQEAGRNIASINAQLPGQIRNQQIQDAQTRMSGGQGIFSGLGGTTGINFHTIEGSRSGGVLGYASQLAPLVGSVGSVMSGSAALKAAKAGK